MTGSTLQAMWTRLSSAPLHPLFFAAFPVLFLFSQNLEDQVAADALARPLSVALGGAVLLLTTLLFVVRDVRRAGLAASILLLLFFSYGHVLWAIEVPDWPYQDELLLFLWLALGAGAAWGTGRLGERVHGATRLLNAVGLALVVMNLVPIIGWDFETPSELTDPPIEELDLSGKAPPKPRDIYYLVFDRYANTDTLERLFHFDNSPFLTFLEERGFFVAKEAAANHQKTAHSLASSLNLTYISDLPEPPTAAARQRTIMALLRDPGIARYLRSVGYRYHHIGSWWMPTAESPYADVNHAYRAASEFSGVLLETTMYPTLRGLLGAQQQGSGLASDPGRLDHQLDALLDIPSDPAPTFTFAHFLLPHGPYLFDKEGNVLSEEVRESRSERENYLEQLQFANQVIEKIVTRLTGGDEEDRPIIILQSDEGPHPPRLEQQQNDFDWFRATDSELQEKLMILNAYYLPGADGVPLHPRISPVNTFRVVLNEYFGERLPLLEDRTLVYRDAARVLDFMDVTDRLRPAEAPTP